ncbi:MAG: hypothetical protein RLY40_1164 [Pseudomonadota bacterium]|jgi:hypothetical protein
MVEIVNQQLEDFVENKINYYAERIKSLPQRADRSALGELEFYIALRNVTSFPNDISQNKYDQASLRDHGLLDAINDTLIELKLIKPDEKFYDL